MTNPDDVIAVGVLGLGFMGKTHLKAYQTAAEGGWPCRVVALADKDPEKAIVGPGGNFDTGSARALIDPDRVNMHTDPDALFNDDAVDAISVCTYTDSHVDMAIGALEAGKHVLVEKPVALRSDDASRLSEAADRSGRVCMPAMCMRFWPAWRWLREVIADGRYGAVRSAVFRRLGSPPRWAEFYGDLGRSGGAMFDLHIHDTDFIVHCFGTPMRVFSTGRPNHLTTSYLFEDGPSHVVAEGGWGHTPSFGFRMRFVVCFDRATVDFDLGRDPELQISDEDGVRAIEVPAITGYDGEVRHFVDIIRGSADPLATVAEAVEVTRVLEAEGRSLSAGEAAGVD